MVQPSARLLHLAELTLVSYRGHAMALIGILFNAVFISSADRTFTEATFGYYFIE